MFERVLLGVGRRMVPVPEWLFRPMVQRDANKLAQRPDLKPDERRVQHFAVREIPRRREGDRARSLCHRARTFPRTGEPDPRRARTSHDLSLPQRRQGRELGLPGDRRGNAPPGPNRRRRSVFGRLSGRRRGDALRARATVGERPRLRGSRPSARSADVRSSSSSTASSAIGVRPPAEKPVFMIPMIDIRNLDSPYIVDDF